MAALLAAIHRQPREATSSSTGSAKPAWWRATCSTRTGRTASRNQFHATLRGNGGTFVDDGQFRRALLLTGDGSHLQLPGETLTGEDTISVAAWLFLPTGASGPLFDFGQNASTRLYAVANPGGGGGADGGGFRAAIVMDGKARTETAAAPIVENRWMHVAVVLDPASRVLTDVPRWRKSGSGGGRDGERRADRQSDEPRREPSLHRPIARRRRADHPCAAARRAHLSHRAERNAGRHDPQERALRTADADDVAPRSAAAGDFDGRDPEDSPLAAKLSHVPDITVNTIVGILPQAADRRAGELSRQQPRADRARDLAGAGRQQPR